MSGALEGGGSYLCAPRRAELSRGTQRVLGYTWYICAPIPGLHPPTTRVGGGEASFLALMQGYCCHTQHEAKEIVGSTQPVGFFF